MAEAGATSLSSDSSIARPMRSPVAELLGALGAVLDRLGVGWYLFGAQAALLYGAARLTADVDVTVEDLLRRARQPA